MIRGLSDGALAPGVYRVLGAAPAIADALGGVGWRAAPLPPLGRVADFYTATARALRFPSFFGGNLDALWDCLTDLTGPTALVLAEWTRLPRADPGGWAGIYAVLRQRADAPPLAAAPAFALVLS